MKLVSIALRFAIFSLFVITPVFGEMLTVKYKVTGPEEVAALTNLGVNLTYVDYKKRICGGMIHSDHLDMIRSIYPTIDDLILEKKSLKLPGTSSPYHNYEEMVVEIHELEKNHPNLVKVHSIGETWQNRTLYEVQINTSPEERETGTSQKPGMLTIGGTHAREHLTTEVVLGLINHIIDHQDDESLSSLINNRDLRFIPMLNPDGAEHDRHPAGHYRSYRKNMRTKNNRLIGVDLNRNMPINFGGIGSSNNPKSDIYHGPSSLSEPETQALADFIQSHENLSVVWDIHSFSKLVLFPWAYTHRQVPHAHLELYQIITLKMTKGMDYQPMQASDLYPASGIIADWAYAMTMNSPRPISGITTELRPASSFDGGFYLPGDQIEPTIKENIQSCVTLIEWAGQGLPALQHSQKLPPFVPTTEGRIQLQ